MFVFFVLLGRPLKWGTSTLVEHRRFAILNIARHLFSEATGESARRAPRKAMMFRLSGHQID
jgi:hypothetical protein